MAQIKCPKCGSTNVSVQMVATGSRTKKSGVGLVGNSYNTFRTIMNVFTLGIFGKIMPKATGKEKTKINNKKMAVCQSCGHSWKLWL